MFSTRIITEAILKLKVVGIDTNNITNLTFQNVRKAFIDFIFKTTDFNDLILLYEYYDFLEKKWPKIIKLRSTKKWQQISELFNEAKIEDISRYSNISYITNMFSINSKFYTFVDEEFCSCDLNEISKTKTDDLVEFVSNPDDTFYVYSKEYLNSVGGLKNADASNALASIAFYVYDVNKIKYSYLIIYNIDAISKSGLVVSKLDFINYIKNDIKSLFKEISQIKNQANKITNELLLGASLISTNINIANIIKRVK